MLSPDLLSLTKNQARHHLRTLEHLRSRDTVALSSHSISSSNRNTNSTNSLPQTSTSTITHRGVIRRDMVVKGSTITRRGAIRQDMVVNKGSQDTISNDMTTGRQSPTQARTGLGHRLL